jgi:hypothetical protein
MPISEPVRRTVNQGFEPLTLVHIRSGRPNHGRLFRRCQPCRSAQTHVPVLVRLAGQVSRIALHQSAPAAPTHDSIEPPIPLRWLIRQIRGSLLAGHTARNIMNAEEMEADLREIDLYLIE